MKSWLQLALCLTGIAFAAGVPAAGETMEIIELKHRLVSQIIPVIRALVPPPGTVTGMHNQLVVRTTAEYHAQVRQALARLDTELRRLRISVRHGFDGVAWQQDQAVSGHYRKGDVNVALPDPGTDSRGMTIRYRDQDGSIRYRTSRNDRSYRAGITQFVQVIEGNQALIRTGQSFPVAQRNVVIGRGHAHVQDSIRYRDVSSGFYVRPRVNGNHVTLEISPQLESRSASHPNAVDTRRVSTVVSGALGEWISIGGSSGSVSTRNSANLGTRTGRSSTNYNVQLLVEDAPKYRGRDIFSNTVNPRP